MAGTGRDKADAVAKLYKALEETPYKFGFFQVMRLMECFHKESPRLGASRRPADDPVRLCQEPSMTFESATLTRFEPEKKEPEKDLDLPPRLFVRFMGLLGPNGPLPLHLTEYAQSRQLHHRDFTFARFLDVFHHRMISLFYRAWANNEPTVSFDRQEIDHFANYIGSLAGLGMTSVQKRDELPDSVKLHYIGRLACQTKNAEGLEAMLSDYFKLPARIKGFIGEWIRLPKENICYLGGNGENGRLNESIVLGKRFWSCQHKFRIIMGPLNYRDYVSLLPIGKRIKRLTAMVRNYIGDELAWDVNLILKKEEVPVVHLNKGYRLGWTTWLADRPKDKDADNLFFAPLA